MANLKTLKTRIKSVRSTQKITSAMKMVAASRLRRAQDAAVAARPYAQRMERMVASVLSNPAVAENGPRLLAGTGSDKVQLLIPVTSDRGLAGGFNATIIRETRRRIATLEGQGKTVKLFCVGRKGAQALRRDHGSKIVGAIEDIGRTGVKFAEAQEIASRVVGMFEAGEFDVATLYFNRFVSAISQIVTPQQIIPVQAPKLEAAPADTHGTPGAVYEYEPSEEEILEALLPGNLRVQIFRALLESSASEHGARMTAMDNATRNAGEMIGKLTMTYNRTRQAQITKELIEIISGAEAL
ncbi:MAG: atpG [Rhodospirillales bacterium]|jgi:F-type H+-transporting ATPase subunit gamma|nr:atpG [Rhodospirillales bacterium]